MSSVVYRAIHKEDGYGPWTNHCNRKELSINEMFDYKHCDTSMYPTWYRDFDDDWLNMLSGMDECPLRCAVPEPYLINYWFGDFPGYMDQYYEIWEIEVKECVIGYSGVQCAYTVDNVIHVKVHSFNDFMSAHNLSVNPEVKKTQYERERNSITSRLTDDEFYALLH